MMILAGALGGVAATLYGNLQNNRFAFPTYNSGWRYLLWLAEGIINIALSAGAGGLASLLLWATFTSAQDFNSTKLTPSEFAAGVTIGLGGVGAILGLMRQKEVGSAWKEASRDNAAMVQDLLTDIGIDDSPAPAHNDEGGSIHEHENHNAAGDG